MNRLLITLLYYHYVGDAGPVRLMFSGRTKQENQNLRHIMQIRIWMLFR